MLVVGGAYIERCQEPQWDQLYGSGGRAAACLATFGSQVELNTCVGDADASALEILAATYKFSVTANSRPETVRFDYLHGLSNPVITPDPRRLGPPLPLPGQSSSVLRFGMLEATGVVHGEYVVYDPQSAFDPRPFAENGSTADHLAIVGNRSEILALSSSFSPGQSADIEGAARSLLVDGCEAVVVKQGTLGALVVTESASRMVPARQTERVWPIGSGDVFAAGFAYFWGEGRQNPDDSAEQACRAAAKYCGSRNLPRLDDLAKEGERSPAGTGEESVYLAGPFFTMAQRWLVNEARNCLLDQRLRVFSPYHDVGHGVASDVVPADLTALRASRSMLALIDGLDSGTLFEIGYAVARDIPVVALVQNETQESLKMLEGSGCIVSDDFVSAIYRVAWAARAA